MVRQPPPLSDRQVDRCFRRAQADRWNLSRETFAEALAACLAHRADGASLPDSEADRILDGLHAADLALATACAAGHDPAWEHFIATVRPTLYRAADAIDPSGAARDLADSLYADLYGTPDEAGARRPLLRYYHGRSSLATWLRAVLSQRYVDRLRSARRLTALPDADVLPTPPPERQGPGSSSERAHFADTLGRVLAIVVAALDPSDRLRLGCYYVQDLTLAEIARLFGEHEATASRKLARVRRTIRDEVTRRLRDEAGFSEAAIAEGFESIVDDAGALDLGTMLGGSTARKNLRQDRSTT